MIVTVTPNPSLDLTYALADEVSAAVDVHRALSATMEPSGKGVNVSRALRAAGVMDGWAVLPVAGATGRYLEELLEAEGIDHSTVVQQGSTRVNTSVLQPSGHTVKLNGPGCVLSGTEQDDLVARASEVLRRRPAGAEAWLAVCGSLPPGVDGGFVGRLVEVAHAAGARCAVDASGEALAAGLEAGADLLAPNRAELAEVDETVREAGPGLDGVVPVLAALASTRGCELLISLGAQGALWTDGRLTLHGAGPVLTPVNTAGAGDALLAGWLAQAGDPAERLERAVRWGRSACLAATTVDPAPGSGDPAAVLVDVLAGARPG